MAGGFWLTFGGTLVPFYATLSSYTTTYASGAAILYPAGFYNSFAFFLLFMYALCFLYTICALRTNVLLVAILSLFVITFPCLTASYFYAAEGRLTLSTNCQIAGGACAFVARLVAWYLFTSMLFEAVDFPLSLPIGDLSTRFKGKSKSRRGSSNWGDSQVNHWQFEARRPLRQVAGVPLT